MRLVLSYMRSLLGDLLLDGFHCAGSGCSVFVFYVHIMTVPKKLDQEWILGRIWKAWSIFLRAKDLFDKRKTMDGRMGG